MGIEENLIKYGIDIGLKRAAAAAVGGILGWIGSPAFAIAVTYLSTIGVTVTIDHSKFDPWLVTGSSTVIVFIHDWLKVRFPNCKWL